MSAIRKYYNSLDEYFFLNKDAKIIQKKYENLYKISEVLNKDGNITMSTAGKEPDDSYEICLVIETVMKARPSTTLE